MKRLLDEDTLRAMARGCAVLGARSADLARSLDPDLQTFEQWVAKNKNKIPL